MIANKEALYGILAENKELYLPSLESKAITSEYLFKLARKEVFSIKRSDIKIPYFTKKILKSDLFEALKAKLPGKDLGFDQFSLPDKEWRLNVLYTIDPQNTIFLKATDIIQREFHAE